MRYLTFLFTLLAGPVLAADSIVLPRSQFGCRYLHDFHTYVTMVVQKDDVARKRFVVEKQGDACTIEEAGTRMFLMRSDRRYGFQCLRPEGQTYCVWMSKWVE